MSDRVRGSGKQVLLDALRALSTRLTPDEELPAASRWLRVGLLAHGSTAEESFEKVSRLVWASEQDERGTVVRQGVATRSGAFLADVLESIFEVPEVANHLRSVHGLSDEEIEAAEHALWAVLSAVQMFSELRSIEVDEPIDSDRWIDYLGSKYDLHFQDRGLKPPE